MPLKPALGVRETPAGHRLGALEGGGGVPPPFQCIPGWGGADPRCPPRCLVTSLQYMRDRYLLLSWPKMQIARQCIYKGVVCKGLKSAARKGEERNAAVRRGKSLWGKGQPKPAPTDLLKGGGVWSPKLEPKTGAQTLSWLLLAHLVPWIWHSCGGHWNDPVTCLSCAWVLCMFWHCFKIHGRITPAV